MGRFRLFSLSLWIIGALVVVSGASHAQVPDPANSAAPRLTYAPDGALTYTVFVEDAFGSPVVGSVVEIVFSANADAAVCWCSGQVHPVISGVTDANGEVTFAIFAGGCIDPTQDPTMYIEVFADTILLNTVGASSPDAVDPGGLFPWMGWNPGICTAGLADYVVHLDAIFLGLASICSKMTPPFNGPVAIADAVTLTPYVGTGLFCTP